jgi:sigma-B regulation protein RsbU (phosphoserine phosphatase)
MCNAGAEPPMIYRRGELLKPETSGVPLGLLEDRQYEEVQFQTEPGDTILFWSDGVPDQLNAQDEDYSSARLTRLLKAHGNEAPKNIADTIIADLDKFRDGTPISDDQTLLVMRVSGE